MAIYMDMVPSTMAKDLNDRVGKNLEGHDGDTQFSHMNIRDRHIGPLLGMQRESIGSWKVGR